MNPSKLVLLLIVVGCGGDKDPATDTPPTDTDDPTTDDTDGTDTDVPSTVVAVQIAAAVGGTVEADGAVLSIPPGALAADTEITVTVGPAAGLPDAGSVVGQVYDFGPDGTVFSTPATLTLPADATLASDERFVVSWLDGGAWTDLPSTTGAGTVSGEVAHFTSFAARAILAAADVNSCAPVAGCGGDLTGTWVAYQSCRMSAGEVPFGCEVPFVSTYDADAGSRTYGADGSFQAVSAGAGTFVTEHTIPAACLPAGLADCAGTYDSVPLETEYVCTGDVAVSCTCAIGPFPANTGTASGTWAVAGSELTETTPGEVGFVDQLFQYCVDGDTLTIWDSRGEPESYTRL